MEARHERASGAGRAGERPAAGKRGSFFARSGLALIKPRGARDYRGAIAGLDGVEVAYLSASEITTQLAAGAVHLGVTGEDLVREMIPDADSKVVLIEGLGFGFATVVVAVPQAWIDVRTMADLDDVGTSFRHTHGRKMRVATKYINLTRDFFSRHGIVDYRIVESSGATEGAAGSAELIVDITTTVALLLLPRSSTRRDRGVRQYWDSRALVPDVLRTDRSWSAPGRRSSTHRLVSAPVRPCRNHKLIAHLRVIGPLFRENAARGSTRTMWRM